jgi:carboxypeptidase Q
MAPIARARPASLFVLCPALIAFALGLVGAQSAPAWLEAYREPASRIIAAATSNTDAWQRLAELTDTFGNRLSGSPQLEAAIRWATAEMKKDGLDNVHTEPAMVPHWVRGAEYADIVQPFPQSLAMLGLGNSVGTPPEGVQAEMLVVKSFEDLQQHKGEAAGRIVVFNVPFTNYGETVVYRSDGPSQAARAGAVAMLLRSVGPPGLRTPHTGVLRYGDDAPKIPAAAISTEDADQLQRMQDRGTPVTVRLVMGAQMLPDVESANVVADLTGRERPEEVVVIGGHSDSWDVGRGAMDDGGGCIVTWEALRVLKRLNLRPRRTIRVVLFVNEENGTRGGMAYRDHHSAELANHVLMLESDSGVFRPLGFGFSGSDAARAIVNQVATLLRPIGADRVGQGGGGTDIGPAVQAGKLPAMALEVDGTRYFLIHHTPADTVDKLDPADMARCVAAIAVMTYVVADMPERLPRDGDGK